MKKFEKVLSILTVYENSLRIIHWNSSGKKFKELHEVAGIFYEKFGNTLDKYTELAIINDEMPVSSKQAIENLFVDEYEYLTVDSQTKYEFKYALESIVKISSDTYTAVLELRNSLTDDMRSSFDEFLEWIRVEAFYKIGQMLKDED